MDHDTDLDDIHVSDDEKEARPEEDENRSVPYGTITAVFEMDPYLAYPNKGCNNCAGK
jgi:hypothetical protein